ncbi:hypothetical protein D3C78_1030570 [compost metagenome]
MTLVFWVVMGVGLVAIINDTIITVTRKTRNASSRGRRTALHISNTMTQVNGHGRNVIATQHSTNVTAMVTSVSSSSFGLRWRSK